MNEEKKTVYCTACGAQNECDAKFCISCGNKLMKPQPEVSIPAPAADSESVAEPELVAEPEAVAEQAEVIPVPPAPKTMPTISDPEDDPGAPVQESVYIPPESLAVDTDPVPGEIPFKENTHYYYNSSANEIPPAEAAPKEKHKKQNFFLKLLSFLLALLLSAALALAIPITLLRFLLTDHNIDVIVDRVIDSIELDKLEFTTSDGTKSLSGILLEITDEFEGWSHITEEQINDALLEDFVKQFVTDTLKQYGMSLKEGEMMLGWTPEEIYGFVEDNKDTIERLAREAGYEGNLPITEKKEMMIANIEEKIGKDGISVNALLENTGISDQINDHLNRAQLIFSDNTLYLIWGIAAFIALLLFFVNFGYFGSFCRSCGFPAFMIGGLYFLLSFAFDPILSLIDLPFETVNSIIEFIAGFLEALIKDISMPVFAAGVALIILSFIADAIKRSIIKKKAAHNKS